MGPAQVRVRVVFHARKGWWFWQIERMRGVPRTDPVLAWSDGWATRKACLRHLNLVTGLGGHVLDSPPRPGNAGLRWRAVLPATAGAPESPPELVRVGSA